MPLLGIGNIQPNETIYEIRVEGQLSAEWSSWFEGLMIGQETNPADGSLITVISGPIPDQPALHGILNKIRDLNLKLISVLTVLGHSTQSSVEPDSIDPSAAGESA